jgi:DNA-binding NtrC family response regulator
MKEKYNILIVSNKEEILQAMKNLLEQEAYEVDTIQGALEAYEKIKNYKYHVVFMDMDITDMDGIELLKQIKSYDALTQVIVMTACSTMDKILSSLEYGANDYISRPTESTEKVMKIIGYTIEKLDRWRASILEIVK